MKRVAKVMVTDGEMEKKAFLEKSLLSAGRHNEEEKEEETVGKEKKKQGGGIDAFLT